MSDSATQRGNWMALVLLLVGSTSMLGDALGWNALRGLGVASVMAPLPKVFSDVDGFETFAADFTLVAESQRMGSVRKPITPAVYAGLAGPYNRRNVYGAALSYAPRLPDEIWRSVFCYGFAAAGPLRLELEVPEDAASVRVLIETRTAGRDDSWMLEGQCSE